MVYLEYIWIDGSGGFRSKIKITDTVMKCLDDIPIWNYDGSSTGQADIETSEVLLIPVKCYRHDSNTQFPWLVLCDTQGSGRDAGRGGSITAAKAVFDRYVAEEPMYGLEQEFFLVGSDNKPIGSQENGDGIYYCGVGKPCAATRGYLLEVMYLCGAVGIKLTGMNYEVAAGQAEFQVCNIGIQACHDLTMLRYIMVKTGETYNITPNFEPKPFVGVNGSGCHLNFSTLAMRNETDRSVVLKTINSMCLKLKATHSEFIEKYYGSGNKLRLTGTNETSSYDVFTVKKASRSVSVRVPTEGNYFEDRRPSSNIDPYLACSKFLECVMN